MSRVGLREVKIFSEITDLIHEWLPATAAAYWNVYTFGDAAAAQGLADCWLGGKISKRPAIQSLLESAYSKSRLEGLLIDVASHAINYRKVKNNPLRRDEIEKVNHLLRNLGTNVPQFSDSVFLALLENKKPEKNQDVRLSTENLGELSKLYDQMLTNPDVQSRGYEFEKFLSKMFDFYKLNPGPPYKVLSEQIDATFFFEGSWYLLEARWRNKKATKSDLAIFSNKIETKASWTRGLFVSINGYSFEAVKAMTIGRTANFVIMSGSELRKILRGESDFIELLRKKLMTLSTRGELEWD